MNFPDVSMLAIKEGRVRKISFNGEVLWKWNKPEREEDILPLATNSYWISTAGKLSAHDTNWISSDKIPVTPPASVRFGLSGHPNVGSVVAYDEDGTVLGCANNTTQNFFESAYDLPTGTAYITITGCSEIYRPNDYVKQYAFLVQLESCPPRYYEDGLVMWCDGYNNTGNGHDNTVSTWKDLTGHGNDLISVAYKTDLVPADTVQGEWKDNGIFIRTVANDPSQRIRTVNEFDLGADRTLEIRFTIVEDMYAAFGFATGDRYKYRIINATTGNPTNDWTRYSASDTVDVITHGLSKSAIVGVPSTMAIVRHYDADTDTTTYTVYLDGVQVGVKSFSGVHRDGETSHILLGNERDVATYHSVRLYNRALSAEEIALNYEYDRLRFVEVTTDD